MGPARFLNGLNITGDLTVTGNILPGANNTYNIGSTSAAWKIGYFKKMSINGGDLSSSTSYTLDVGGTSNFDGNANFSANITVAGTSNLQGDTIVGTTSGNGLNKTLTVNGKVVVNPSYNTANNLYNEGIRINQASNGWAEVAFGGAAGTTSGVSDNIWLVGTYSKNFYISYNGNHTAGNRFQGTPNGFRIYSNTASGALQTGTLTLGSTDSAYNGSGSGGDVALEFWRGKNASWQIINTGGTLKFRNNYTSAAHSSYDVNGLDLGYGGNDSIIYTNFKPSLTSGATQSTLTLGLATANWDSIYTKTLNFGYDNTDQYLTHSGVATLGTNHSGKITLYRLLASGTSGTRASGSKLRPAVVLDAATGLISLEAGSTNPSASAGGRIEFKYYNSDSDLGQPVYLSHSVNDSYRPPYGLKVWSDTSNVNPYAWFEIEGSLYIGTHSSATSGTDTDKKRLATSIYIGTKSNGTWNIGNAAISGYDTWLRLNDLIDFTSGTYSPFEIRSNTALSVAADTLVSDTNKHDATFYTGVDNATTGTTVTYINTSKNIIFNRTSIGTEDATTDDNLFYVDNWSKFKGDLRPDATNTYNLGTSNKRWKTLFIGDSDTYGEAGQPIYWNAGVPKAIDWHVGNSSTGEHNCNNVAYNFSGYYTSNGPTAAANGAETGDASLWAQAYSTAWVTQMAQDYRTGQPWVRSKNNGTWTTWKKVVVADESSTTVTDCNNVKFTGIWTHTGFANRPTGVANWGSLFNIRLYNSNNNYHRQLFFDCYGTNKIWTRANNGGTWTSWDELVRNTGTWDISITGNAATSTAAKYVDLYEARGTTTSLNKPANYIGAGKMFHLIASSSTTTGKCSFDANVLQMNWDNNGGYDSQLAISTSGSRMQIRSQVSAGTAWREVVTAPAATAVGNGTNLIAVNDTGQISASASTVGSTIRPVFLSGGTLTAVSWYHNYCTINGGNKANYPWHRFATVTTGTGQYVDKDVVVVIQGRFNNGPFGIVKLSVRTNASGAVMDCSATWIIRSGMAVGDVIITPATGTATTGTDTRFDAYIKCSTWPRRLAYILEGANNGWSLINSNEVNDTTATDSLTSTEVVASVSGTVSTDSGVVLRATQDANGAEITSTYVKKAGDTMTGALIMNNENQVRLKIARKQASGSGWAYNGISYIGNDNADFAHIGVLGNANALTYMFIGSNTYDSVNNLRIYPNGDVRGNKVYGAVWNDYAEYRQTKEDIKPGRIVIEVGNGDMKLSDRRLQPGANVVTDTFGFAIGETETHKTPIAVSGRVLAYPYESIEEFKNNIGSPVCSGPNGTVSIMNTKEERLYPSRIIGTISEIPEYETWGTKNIKVNGRIWIRIR